MIDPARVLSGIPAGLRDPLLTRYREIASNYAERRWEPSELNGGKFCEVVYSIISGAIGGAFPASPSKLSDIVGSCRALEATPASQRQGDRSLRILIPRALPWLYDIRNNRGVGHIGGDVDPNFLDATAVYGMASWILAELIRIFHATSPEEAQETVDVLIERKRSLIWKFEDMSRVLAPKMSKRGQALLLLHAKPSWVPEKDLFRWVEYSNATVFRDEILRQLHKSRLIEFDDKQHRVRISPLGIDEVEKQILKTRVP